MIYYTFPSQPHWPMKRIVGSCFLLSSTLTTIWTISNNVGKMILNYIIFNFVLSRRLWNLWPWSCLFIWKEPIVLFVKTSNSYWTHGWDLSNSVKEPALPRQDVRDSGFDPWVMNAFLSDCGSYLLFLIIYEFYYDCWMLFCTHWNTYIIFSIILWTG